jgi:hypothetical protein
MLSIILLLFGFATVLVAAAYWPIRLVAAAENLNEDLDVRARRSGV